MSLFSPESLFQVLQRVLGWIHARLVAATDALHDLKELARSTLRAAKRRGNHILKAAGILFTISFAAASLYYAKAAAHDARCQLRLAQQQYCETQPDYIARQSPCKEVLDRSMRSLMSCDMPWSHQEWVFSIFRPLSPAGKRCGGWHQSGRLHTAYKFLPFLHRQEYSRCGDTLYCGEPWWHQWGGLYTTYRFRPVFWRFPDAYQIAEYSRGYLGTGLLGIGIAGSLLILYRWRGNRKYFQVVLLLSFMVVPQIFSWWLLVAELVNQKNYWERARDKMLQTGSFDWY